MTGALSKDAWREHFRAKRAALTDEEYVRRSRAIMTRLRSLPELGAAQTVHCYWPLTDRREVDTRPLIAALHAEGLRVVLPVVAPSSAGAPAMTLRCYTGRACLRPNRWGLHEPTGTEAVPAHAVDLVIVPAFGAGRNGHRIGHGFGYYDAFLCGLDAATVCPVYQDCLVARVPAEAHDVPLSILVTEMAVLRPGT